MSVLVKEIAFNAISHTVQLRFKYGLTLISAIIVQTSGTYGYDVHLGH